jgi:hypothetical protein
MKLFFERKQNEDATTIIFKPYSMYLLLIVLVALMAVTFVPALAEYERVGSALIYIAAGVVLARVVVMFKVNREIQAAIRNDNVKVSGGKLSATNPLTFIISNQIDAPDIEN